MSAIEGVVAYQGWSLRGVPLYMGLNLVLYAVKFGYLWLNLVLYEINLKYLWG